MVISKENAEIIKKQLLQQIETLPTENKGKLKEYIKTLNEEQLEEFLKQNNIQTTTKSQNQVQSENENEKPIFQSIVEGEIPSYQIAENKEAIAILELNPLSLGHTIIIPKKQTTVEKLPKQVFNLAQKVSKKIKIKLKPHDIKIETSSFQDYPMINIIPIYKNKSLQKIKAETKQLEELKSKLEIKKRNRTISVKRKQNTNKNKKIKSNLKEISFRIP